jgi:hypothetical protein
LQAVLFLLGIVFWLIAALIVTTLVLSSGGALHELTAATLAGFGTLFFVASRALTYWERQTLAAEKNAESIDAMHRTLALNTRYDQAA